MMWWLSEPRHIVEWWGSPLVLLAIVVSYLAIVHICIGRRLSIAVSLAAVQMLALALGSLALIVIFINDMWPLIVAKTPWFELLCDEHGLLWNRGIIWRVQALNYALKVLEMTHSPMLALSGRQVSGMHRFHQVCMLSVAWSQLGTTGCSVQWLPIILNAIAHVYMYTCLLAAFCGSKKHWNVLLPKLQVVQVMVTGVSLALVMGTRTLHEFYDSSQFAKCSGTWSSAIFASCLVFTYPLAYLLLHRPVAEEDAWLGERGIGLFVSIWGVNVRRDEEKIRYSRSQQNLLKTE